MLKIFILLVIATNFIFAGNLKVGDKLKSVKLKENFPLSKILRIYKKIRRSNYSF
jgi:hypothetical protein